MNLSHNLSFHSFRVALPVTSLILSVVVFMVASGDRAAASIIGDLVYGELISKDYPGLGNLFDPVAKPGCPECTVPSFPASSGIQPYAIVVEPDIVFPEFIFRETGELEVKADIDHSTVDIEIANISGNLATETPFGWELRILDIDWVSGPPGMLVSATVEDDSQFPGLTASVIENGTGILIDFPGGGTNPQEVLDVYNENWKLWARIVFTAKHIPEPASCSLLALGALCLGWRRREVRGRSASSLRRAPSQ